MRIDMQFAAAERHMAVGDGDRQRDRFADEGDDERRSRAVVKLFRRPNLFDAAFVEHDDAIRKLHRFILIMRDENRRQSRLLVNVAQPAAQILAHARVKGAEGLVEQQHARFDGERARKRDALTLAAGELRGIAAAESVELHELQKLRDARLDRRPRGTRASGANSQTVADIVGDGHMFEERIVLKHHADMAVLHGEIGRVLAVEEDPATIGRIEARDHPQQRRLAGARGSKQRDEFARLNVKANVAQGRKGAEILLDSLDANGSSALTSLSGGERVQRARRRDATRGRS
ncbi:MAG: phenol hydroxylase [Methylocystaceae bacterium]|nr:MAG: phenol hydroxylase [Methylocystaceae bacterium]